MGVFIYVVLRMQVVNETAYTLRHMLCRVAEPPVTSCCSVCVRVRRSGIRLVGGVGWFGG